MDEIQLGGRYLFDGHPATVVAIPGEGKFDPSYPAEDWAATLVTGILVEDDHAGLIHYPNPRDIRIEPLRQ